MVAINTEVKKVIAPASSPVKAPTVSTASGAAMGSIGQGITGTVFSPKTTSSPVVAPSTTGIKSNPLSGGVGGLAGAYNINKAQTSVVAPQLTKQQNSYMAQNFNGGTDGYIQSQLQRYQTANPNDQAAITADLKRFGVNPTPGVGGGAATPQGTTGIDPTTGLPTWIGASAQNDIDQQISALQGQQTSAQQAEQFGINQNNAYLAEQLAALRAQNVVDQQGAQELQNRRGGFYSGGLDYQLGSINSAYANQQGALARDVASRNQQLIDQYGTQANTIAKQISQLQSSAPGIIQEKLNDYINQQAQLTGNYLGQRTLAGQAQDESVKQNNIANALDIAAQTGYNVTPQNDASGYWRQLATGKDSNGNPLTQTQAAKLADEQQAYQVARDAIADKQWQAQFDQNANQFGLNYALQQLQEKNDQAYKSATLALNQDQNDLAWVKEQFDENNPSGGSSGNSYSGLTPNQVLENIKGQFTVQDPSTKKNRITADPTQRENMFLQVLDSTEGMSDAQVDQILANLGLTKKEIDTFSKNQSGK